MAEGYQELDIFSHCKVCNAPTNRTTILKHMSFKKTLVHNVLKHVRTTIQKNMIQLRMKLLN